MDKTDAIIDSLKLELRLKEAESRITTEEIKIQNALDKLNDNKEYLDYKSEKLDSLVTVLAFVFTISTLTVAVVGLTLTTNITTQSKQALKKIKADLEQIVQNETTQLVKKVNEETETAINKANQLSETAIRSVQAEAKKTIKRMNDNADAEINSIYKLSVDAKERIDAFMAGQMNEMADRALPIKEAKEELINLVGEENVDELKINKEYPELLLEYKQNHLAKVNEYFEKGDWQHANWAISKYLKYDSNNGDIFYKRGICQFFTPGSHIGRAIESFEKALKIDSSHCGALYGLLHCYESSNRYISEYNATLLKIQQQGCASDPILVLHQA